MTGNLFALIPIIAAKTLNQTFTFQQSVQNVLRNQIKRANFPRFIAFIYCFNKFS